MEYGNAVWDMLLDRTPREYIGAIFVVVALAMAMAGVQMLCRRWVKDPTIAMVVPAIAFLVAAMTLGGGYVRMVERPQVAVPRGETRFASLPHAPPRGHVGFADELAAMIAGSIDADHDGSISADEAAVAARQFVTTASTDGRATIDSTALSGLIRGRLRPFEHHAFRPGEGPHGAAY